MTAIANSADAILTAELSGDGGFKVLSPVYPTTNRLGVLSLGGERYIVKQYVGPAAGQRRDCERSMLQLWGDAGYQVPELQDAHVDFVQQPYLIRRFVSGRSLREHLHDRSTTRGDKLSAVFIACLAIEERHRRVIQSGDLRFIHPDANTGNIVISGDTPVWIDFETALGRTDPIDAAAVELSRFLLCVAQDLPGEDLQEVVELSCAVFRQQSAILERIRRRTLERPLQAVHRWRDRRRKACDPGRITKYDLADALACHGAAIRS
jgi:tRNA A-37 threonylcarbamoyl transferase component Bud32